MPLGSTLVEVYTCPSSSPSLAKGLKVSLDALVGEARPTHNYTEGSPSFIKEVRSGPSGALPCQK